MSVVGECEQQTASQRVTHSRTVDVAETASLTLLSMV